MELITTHIKDGINLLISQYQGRSIIEGWLKSALQQVQDLEDAINAVTYAYQLDTAVNDRLDALGVIVGQARNGLSDDVYRTFIRARIAVNKSVGTPIDMINVATLLDETPSYLEQYPASITIALYNNLSNMQIRSAVNSLLQAAKAAGVTLTVIDTFIGEPNPFVFTSIEPNIFGTAFSSVNAAIDNPGLWTSVILA